MFAPDAVQRAYGTPRSLARFRENDSPRRRSRERENITKGKKEEGGEEGRGGTWMICSSDSRGDGRR